MGSVEALVRRVPPDVALALTDVAIGLALIIPSPAREGTPAFTAARDLLPIRVWGALFVLAAAALALAMRRRWHQPFAFVARVVGAGLYAAWAISFAVSAVSDFGPYVGAVAFAFLAYRHSYPPVVQ